MGACSPLGAETGNTAWATRAGPGGELGVLSWGNAVDKKRAYYTVENSANEAWQLQQRRA